MDISVVIVSYRVKYFLEQTLRAAQEALQGYESEIIVVDNNSGGDTMPFIKARFPQVKFIENDHNVGFGRANNQAIMQVQGTHTVILNPDTIITPQCIGRCVEWMQSHPRCGAIGLHMLDGNGVFLPESKRAFPTPWVSFCKIFGLSMLFPRSPWLAKYHLRFLDEHQAHRIDILSGAFMFCRTRLLQDIKGFDPDFFMYGEDIDISYRMVQQGFDNWYLPVDMVHYKGESTKKDSLRYVQVFYDAMLIFYRKHYPGFGLLAYPFIKLGVWLRQGIAIAKRLAGRVVHYFKAQPTAIAGSWVILSQQPHHVAQQMGIDTFATSIPPTSNANVLLDDESYNYSQLVDIIARETRRGVLFHIYASRNKVLITPKMKD